MKAQLADLETRVEALESTKSSPDESTDPNEDPNVTSKLFPNFDA
jgi:hypothetical protein